MSALTRRLAARAGYDEVTAAWTARPGNVPLLDVLWSAIEAGDEVGVQRAQAALRGPLAARQAVVAAEAGRVRAVPQVRHLPGDVVDVPLPEVPARRLGGAYARARARKAG
jgi:hypothetical protein